MELVQRHEYETGIAELQEAYNILPHPAVVYNIGQAAAEAGYYKLALEAFQLYLDTDPLDKAEVMTLVAAIEARTNGTVLAAGPAGTPPAGDESGTGWTRGATGTTAAGTPGTSGVPTGPIAVATPPAGTSGAATPAGVGTSVPAQKAPPGSAPKKVLSDDLYEEQVVSASRYAQSPLDAPNSTTIITAQDIRMSGVVSSPAQLVFRAAGVDVMLNGSSDAQVSIRGFNQRVNNKIVWLVDGRTMNVDTVNSAFINAIPVAYEDIERIEIIRGPASAVYGADAFTGVINIITKRPGERRGGWSTLSRGNHNAYRAMGGITERYGPLSIRLSGGTEGMDRKVIALPPDRVDYDRVVQDPNIDGHRSLFDGQASLKLGKGWSIDFGGAINHSQPGTVLSTGLLRNQYAVVSNLSQSHITLKSPVGFGARVFHNFTKTIVQNETNPLGQFDELSHLRSNVIDAELTYGNTGHLVVDHRFVVGASTRYKRVQWNWLEGDLAKQQHYAVFAQDTLSMAKWLDVHLSGRVDRHPLLGNLFSPRGAFILKPTSQQSIRISGASAFRSPNFVESYLDAENQSGIPGVTVTSDNNLRLKPERIYSAEIGYGNQQLDWLALELNVYYNHITDLIFTTALTYPQLADMPSYNPDTQAFPAATQAPKNEPLAWNQVGGEAGIRLFPYDGIDFYANYAHNFIEAKGYDPIVPGREKDHRTPTHKVNAGVQYRAPFGLEASADVFFVGKTSWAEDAIDPVRGLLYKQFSVPAYFLTQARLGYKVYKDKLELGGNVFNILDTNVRPHPFSQPLSRTWTLYGRLVF